MSPTDDTTNTGPATDAGGTDDRDERTEALPRTDGRDERTEALPRTDTTQQLPVTEDVATEAREPVETTVFGAMAPEEAGPERAAAWPPPVPPRPTGPHAPAIILGLVALAVAGIVLAQELGNLTVDWGNVGPLGFVGVGAVLVVLGAVGLVGSHRRNARS